jgi:hypothetical protein
MKQISSKDILNQYQKYITFDEPIPYVAKNMIDIYEQVKQQIQQMKMTSTTNVEENKLKQETINNMEQSLEGMTLQIYPFKMTDYYSFGLLQCLQIKKNEIPDIKIIKMKYLDFLFTTDEYFTMLILLLKICLQIDENNIIPNKDDKGHIVLNLNGIEYTWQDFDLIKEIICCQNILDYDNSYIDPDVEKMLKEIEEMQNKNRKSPSLDKQMAAVVVSSPYKYEELYKMSIRKFLITLKQADLKLYYQIYTLGDINGMLQSGKHIFGKEIKHWIYGEDDDKFAGKLDKYSNFKDKMKSVT